MPHYEREGKSYPKTPESLKALTSDAIAGLANWDGLNADERKALEPAKALVDAHNRVEHGKVMQVVRGRKVPKGTEGRVFWMRDGRVGLALSDRKDARGYHADVVWVDAGYLVNAAPMAA